MIIPDNETAVDLLYYEKISSTIARLIREKPDMPISIGVHGDWGAGKSSVLMMIENEFNKDDRILCVRFNGWLFQGFDDAKTSLIENIVSELLRKQPSVANQANKVIKRANWIKSVGKAGVYSLMLSSGILNPEVIKVLDESVSAIFSKKENAGEENFLEGNAPEQIHAFREEFEDLIKQANVSHLVVLVDDLDRCLPEVAIETLEAIRLFLFVPCTAFVIAADERMIEYAVDQHFPNFPAATVPGAYARNYLEKLIQVPFRLPSLGYAETHIYITLLLVLDTCGEESDEFIKIAEYAREVLRRPWEEPGFVLQKIEEEILNPIGCVHEDVRELLELSGWISPILAEGTNGNPRQIKRFINAMRLRLEIAKERGFGDIDISILAKVMLAERFAPDLYDAIERDSASTGSGASKDLKKLEALAAQTHPEEPEIKSILDKIRETLIKSAHPKLPNLEWAKKWAMIKPALAKEDLRPYLLVTRDRRSFYDS